MQRERECSSEEGQAAAWVGRKEEEQEGVKSLETHRNQEKKEYACMLGESGVCVCVC